MDRETKAGTGFITKADAEKGIITAIFSVFGNVDNGGDIVHPGAFTKTFSETGLQVLVLDQHRTDSVARALGKPLALRELGADELPAELLEQFPDAVGGAEAEVQFLMSTPEGSGAFERLKEKVITQWSFAFQPLDADFSEVMIDGEAHTVRNLRTVKLFEISPVLFGMNEATTTTSAKEDDNVALLDKTLETASRLLENFKVIAKELEALFKELEAINVSILDDLNDIDNAPPPDAGAAEIEQDDEKEAGPDTEPPTSDDVLVELKKELLELDRLEVEGYGL